MESLLARALESKLKYWLKSFTREQFKLQGRTVQLCNLDINGEVLHSSIGLPPTLVVSQARVGRLEIKVPPFANVQIEPLVVEIDKLDLVLVEKSGSDTELLYNMSQGASVISKSNSYGFADKIADGMTLQVGTVNLMLETRGGTTGQEGAAWTPPLAAITIRNLLLYTTNECWQVVNLKEARDFSNNKKCIYVFKKLEWDSLSVDLLPHPDMFCDEGLTSSAMTQSKLDRDGAKRLFFGGERFLDNISGKAHITMHRTEQNNPLGLEVQVHIPEAVCSALSEPGLRALLRFMTGMYVCMNRGDVGPKTMQVGTEAAERTIVSATVDHIFICIKDADFQLELLVQSLQYIRSSLTNGDLTKTMAQIAIGGFFLRDTFQHPYTTLVQPGITSSSNQPFPRPNFASEKLWPRIYPLIDDQDSSSFKAPLLCMFSIQTIPSPAPPNLASQTVVQCQPFKVKLQEESCLRIASFLVDGVVVDRGVVIPTTSVDSMYLTLKQLDLTLPVEAPKDNMELQDVFVTTEFTGIRLHAEELTFVQSPSLTFKILELEKDPACFMLWQGQPIDASQRRWVMRAMNLSVSLEKGSHIDVSQIQTESNGPAGFWTCIGIAELCFEAAMVTGDGDPLVTVPPPRGIVRFGFHCMKLTSDTSVEQLFFVLRMYEHLGMVYESLLKVTKAAKREKSEKVLQASSMKKLGSFGSILELAPSDTAVNLGLGLLELRFLESLSGKHDSQGPPLVQISGNKINLKVSHRTLGGAIAVSSRLYWQDALVECVETDQVYANSSFRATDYDATWSSDFQNIPEWRTQSEQEFPMRPVFWTCNKDPESRRTTLDRPCTSTNEIYFLDINVVNVIPYRPEDAECHSLSVVAKICGVRLGGGMAFGEVLLHRFGILGPDGGPGQGLKRVLKDLSSGPFARLLKPAAQIVSDVAPADEKWQLGSPDEIEINIQLRDWIFALQGCDGESDLRGTQGERCWHSFRCLHVTAQGVPTSMKDINNTVQRISVAIEGLEIIKPQSPASILAGSFKPVTLSNGAHSGVIKELSEMRILEDREPGHDGLNIEVVFCLRESETDTDMHMGQWAIDSMRAGIKKPVEVEATKAEVEYVIETVKVELEAASRIAAGLMQLLQLQGSIGHAAIEQLSSLGSGSLERLITAEKPGRRSSLGSVASMPLHSGSWPEKSNLDSNMLKLEQAVLNSKDICNGLSKRFSEAGNCKEDAMPSELTSLQQQLAAMQVLLDNIRKSI